MSASDLYTLKYNIKRALAEPDSSNQVTEKS